MTPDLVAVIGVASVAFLVVAIGSALLLRIERLPVRRAEILTIASLAFAITVTASVFDAAGLIAMAGSGWVFTKAVSRNKGVGLFASAIVVIVLEFLAIRQFVPGEAWLPGVMLGRTIGLSYVMFRVIHLIVDAHDDQLAGAVGWRDYICYLCFFPTFLAGPIQRWQDFTTELSRVTPALSSLPPWEAIGAITGGYFKFIVLAGLFLAAFDWSGGTSFIDAPHSAMAFLCFGGYLYASFAGYTDVVRGVAHLFDFRLPKNFDRPIASTDFLDLWSRWHMTLSEWFKLYLFNPLTKAMIAAVDRPRWVPLLGAGGYLATFFMMGLWHGTTARFALYGLCLGAGAGINKLFQTVMVQRLGRRRYGLLSQHAFYIALSRGLALTYFVLALGFFWLPAAAAPSSPAIWAATAALVLFGMLVAGAAADFGAKIGRRIAPAPSGRLLLAMARS